MYEGFKLGACLPTFASCADRYCLSGYGRGGTTPNVASQFRSSARSTR